MGCSRSTEAERSKASCGKNRFTWFTFTFVNTLRCLCVEHLSRVVAAHVHTNAFNVGYATDAYPVDSLFYLRRIANQHIIIN